MIIQGHHLKGEFYISLTYSVKIIHFSPNDSFIKRFYKIKKISDQGFTEIRPSNASMSKSYASTH